MEGLSTLSSALAVAILGVVVVSVLLKGVPALNRDFFTKNAPLLWAHDARSLPIGAITAVEVAANGLRATWRWLKGDVFAERVKNAWDQGIVRAASIGFAPRASEPNAWGGRDFSSWELLEVSLVPIPANAEAVRTLKLLGLWNDVPLSRARDDRHQGDDTVLVLRDGPIANPNVPGKPTCPGPNGTGCQWRHPMSILQCPAARCPIRGENTSDGVRRGQTVLVLDDAPPTRTVEELIVATLRAVVEEEVAKAARHATMMVTGRVD